MGWRLLFLVLCVMSRFALGAADSFDGFFNESKKHFQQGQYYLALGDLESAKKLSVSAEQKVQVYGMLGLVHYQMHQYEQAEKFLRKSIDLGSDDLRDQVRWMATLAELKVVQKKLDEARSLYADALNLTDNDQAIKLRIRLGQAALLPKEQRLAELTRIRDGLISQVEPQERARNLIHLGTQAKTLGEVGLKLAYESFEQARQAAGEQQPRLRAESLDSLAQLYEDQKRQDDAIRLNRQALQVAQGIGAHDLLLGIEWRQARLHKNLNQIPEALVSFQHAVDHIEAIRQDIPIEYQHGRSSFREELAPVYLGLSDMLLVQASQQEGEAKAVSLRRARETVEKIKQFELEEFLGGHCTVLSSKSELETVETTTAIIYPIILPNRLEILVSIGNEIKQFTTPVAEGELRNSAQQLAKNLRIFNGDVKPNAKKLYNWLIAPIDTKWLAAHHVQTLVMVPDGELRMIPPGVLYNGHKYLIENYALAVSPGLTLFDSTPLQHRGLKVLLAGMSEAGPVADRISPAFLQALAGGDGRGADEIDVTALERDPVFRQKLKKELGLPGVAKEIDMLRKLVPSTVLMNQEFTVENFKHQVVQEPYSVVHIASHGVFSNTAENSFILAYDDVINIDEVERLLKSDKFAKQPVELLTLSACQTAEGDDRAPLGFSGIALKAKVRSALGTLWPISDDAAPLLMSDFYKSLLQPGVSKAQALQKAQVALIRNEKLAHPYFWSAFILVGSWL